MAVPTRASQLIDLMKRNSFSANEYVRGKLSAVLAGFAAGKSEPHFITSHGSPVAALLSLNDLERIVEVLETLEQVRERQEERLAALAERRSGLPVTTTLEAVLERYDVDPQRVRQIASQIDFE